jgi:uncharacterized membrane-anchored protein
MLIMVVLIQAIFLSGWAGYHERLQRSAPTVRLKVLPVDPRDPLRGDFMILRYAISEHTLPDDRADLHGDVWVALREGEEGLHVIDEIVQMETRPADTDRQWVKASAHPAYSPPGTPGRIELNYGIERLFVPEGRGTPRFDRLEIEASVNASGRLFIKRAWLDGEIFP